MEGHVHVLEWWARSPLEMRFTPTGLALAHKFKYSAVVDWWARRSTLLETSTDLVTLASHGLIDRLRTFNLPPAADLRSDYTLRLDHEPLIDVVCRAGQIAVLNAFVDHFTLLAESSSDPLVAAAKFNHTCVLEWWMMHSPANAYWDNVARAVGEFGALDTLKWMLSHKLLDLDADDAPGFLEYMPPGQKRLPHVAVVFDHAVVNGHVDVLECCLSTGLVDLDTFGEAADYLHVAALYGHVGVIRWWVTRGYPVEEFASERIVARAVKGNQGGVVREVMSCAQLRDDLAGAWELDASESTESMFDAHVAFCDDLVS
ncbi:hypothetical protein BCR44DRAFT_178557 [Catenaria anguillulae PL171]|uniref:Ankyrin repeat-containing domain protein n=1 Tax=Catenaria anguillulae PL171 TaxID=765915 RepID=A0A1Y2H7D1_9FUNG|nr:hypothetical protein BCR44DRAFT_178557 [Catenaria anguillulae PL171]